MPAPWGRGLPGWGQAHWYSLLRTSRKDTRTVSSPATATWLMSWRSLWYGQRVSVPLPRWVRPWCGRESTRERGGATPGTSSPARQECDTPGTPLTSHTQGRDPNPPLPCHERQVPDHHLGQPHHEEVVGVLGVVLGELPQHRCQTGIVGTWGRGGAGRVRHSAQVSHLPPDTSPKPGRPPPAYHCPPCPWRRWSCRRPRGQRRGRTC